MIIHCMQLTTVLLQLILKIAWNVDISVWGKLLVHMSIFIASCFCILDATYLLVLSYMRILADCSCVIDCHASISMKHAIFDSVG